MSAAATAAGYLYASGRLRGRQAKEQDEGHRKAETAKPRRELKVAAMPAPQDTRQEAGPKPEAGPKRQPTIQYRTRRWRPDDAAKPE
jgi:hypothetical protein